MKSASKPGDLYREFQVKKKNWISGAIKHPGALHRELGVPAGKKIPPKKLAAAAKKGGKEGKRARLAQTLKSFHKTKKKSVVGMYQDATKGLQDFGRKGVRPLIKAIAHIPAAMTSTPGLRKK